jgi:hypothetical protein
MSRPVRARGRKSRDNILHAPWRQGFFCREIPSPAVQQVCTKIQIALTAQARKMPSCGNLFGPRA